MAATRYVGMGKETTYGTAVAATRYGETIASLKPDQGWKIPKPVAYRAFMKKYLGPYQTMETLAISLLNLKILLVSFCWAFLVT